MGAYRGFHIGVDFRAKKFLEKYVPGVGGYPRSLTKSTVKTPRGEVVLLVYTIPQGKEKGGSHLLASF